MADVLDLKITSLGAQGDGVAEHEGVAVFVPGAMPGDHVSARTAQIGKNGISATLETILKPSSERIEPPCPHFTTCGGCSLQYVGEGAYRPWLKERAIMALSHHGFSRDVVAEPIISPKASRRRIALKALKVAGGLVMGFAEGKSHQIVDIQECMVTRAEITVLFKPLKALLSGLLPQRMKAAVHLTLTASGIDMLVDAPMELSLAMRETLVAFANTHDIASLHWRDEGFLDPVAIRREPMMNFTGVKVLLVPASFIQATAEGEAALVAEVLKAVEGHKRVADLFSGMGTFTLPLARQHQVLAVEGAKAALDSLMAGVNMAGETLKQVIPLHRDLFRRPMTAKELVAFDAVVFDPPRAGAKEQALEIAQSSVRTVVAVSCNPNTFSRDARILADGGYELMRVVPVDQFLWSPHLELVGVFRK